MHSSTGSSIYLPTSYAGHGEQSSPDILFHNNFAPALPEQSHASYPAAFPQSVMYEAQGGTQACYIPVTQSTSTGLFLWDEPSPGLADWGQLTCWEPCIQQCDHFSHMDFITQHLRLEMKDRLKTETLHTHVCLTTPKSPLVLWHSFSLTWQRVPVYLVRC